MPASDSTAPPRVLIADDQVDVRRALRLLLQAEGFETREVESPDAVPGALEDGDVDVVLLDVDENGEAAGPARNGGLGLLPRLRKLDPTLSVLAMASFASELGPDESLRHGARDCVRKPWDNRSLVRVLHTHAALTRALRRSRQAEDAAARLHRAPLPELVAESPAMQAVRALVRRAAPTETPVLLRGEPGTGRSLLARGLHAGSHRAHAPFAVFRVDGRPEAELEAELLGSLGGASPEARIDRMGVLEAADGGTLFLDRVERLPLGLQERLAEALRTGRFRRPGSARTRRADVRVLASTDADLAAASRAGRFREDLRELLASVEVELPPLRERPEDVLPLARAFLARHAERYGRSAPELSPAASEALARHAWPGNVRELELACERAVLSARGDAVTAADLGLAPPAPGPAAPEPEEPPEAAPAAPAEPPTAGDRPIDAFTLEEAERHLIKTAMDRYGGNVTRAAESLGLSRSALYRRLKRLGL